MKEGEWKRKEGFSVFLPTVSLNASHYFDRKFQLINVPLGGGPIVEFPQIFPSTSANLSARWVLFDGLANLHLYQSGSRAEDAAKEQYDWAKFQLEREVLLAYSRVIAARKLESVARENLKTLENHMDQIGNLKKAGLATEYDVLRVETQFSEAQSELLQAKDNIEIARDRLSVAIGGGSPPEVNEDSLPEPNPEAIRALKYPENSPNRLDLKAAKSQVEAAENIDSASSSFWFPKVSLGADYFQYNNLSNTLSNWGGYREAWSVGVFVNWTLFNARDFSMAKQNHYRAISSARTLQKLRIEAPSDFAFWKRRYLYSASLYHAKIADLKRAQETVRLANAGFKAGVRTTTEVLDAELELFRARAGMVNTQMNCLEAKIKLELNTGESL